MPKAYELIAKKPSGIVFLNLDLIHLVPLIEFHKINKRNFTFILFELVALQISKHYPFSLQIKFGASKLNSYNNNLV